MIASWGLLAFLKAADTRQNASFAIRLDKKGEFEYCEQELEGGVLEDPEEIFRSVPSAPRASDRKRASSDTAVVKRSGRSGRRPIQYTDVSDDDFFESFERAAPKPQGRESRQPSRTSRQAQPSRQPSRTQPRPSGQKQPRRSHSSLDDDPLLRTLQNGPSDDDNDRPLTLDDIFGGDDK